MKVSIIVPIYNMEKHLEQCIDSIILQTYKDLEVILVNDGSTDRSSEICDMYSKKDSRIKVIHKKNGGVSSARNVGISSATGEYVLFVDSDDYISSDMVNVLLSTIEENKVDLVVCGFVVFSNGHINNICYNSALYNNKEQIASFFSLLEGRTNSPCNKMYRKNLIKKHFDVNLVVGEDLIFNLDYITECNSIFVVDKSLYFYRRENQNSLSKLFHKNIFEIILYLHERQVKYIHEASNGKVKSDIIDLNFYKDFISFLIGLVDSSKNTTKIKVKSIREIYGNEKMRNIILNIQTMPIKYKFFRILIKYRIASLTLVIINIWLIKKKISKMLMLL